MTDNYRHLNPTQEMISPRSRAYEQGKYGRLFPWLPPQSCNNNREKDLEDFKLIAEAMFQPKLPEDVAPAGYTYFGQFIAHDLTFDPTSIGERQVDPESLWNFRTPALDLDCLYGSGPLVEPVYYKYNKGSIRAKFGSETLNGFFDLPRVTGENGKRYDAIIPDSRNDENVILSQLHLAFMKLHNVLLKRLLPDKKNAGRAELYDAFLKTQELVRWRYQYVIINDYLKTVVDGANVAKKPGNTVDEILNKGEYKLKYYDWRNEPFIPLEFSTALFRFGHAQIKACYDFNEKESQKLLFSNRRHRREPFTYVDWSKFFFNPSTPREGTRNLSAGISNKITEELRNTLPDVTMPIERSLPYRNLVKGLMMELPSGQSVANAMGIAPLDNATFYRLTEDIFPAELKEKYKDNTPLWYYILLEGSQNEGQKLGPVGGRLIAEVIIGLIKGDKTSYLNQFPKWNPLNKDNEPYKNYSIVDLLEEAGVYHGARTKRSVITPSTVPPPPPDTL